MKKHLLALLPALLIAVAFTPSARAQFFAPNVAVTQDSDVLTDGTTVLAFSLYDNNHATTSVVNGITFSGSYTQNGVTFSTTLTAQTNAGAIKLSGMSTDFENILTRNGYKLASAGTGSFTLTNLTPGTTYALQLFAASTGGAQGAETLTDGAATGSLNYGTNGATGTPSAADYVIETFTANMSGTETISAVAVPGTTGNNATVYNAVNLRVVPEPSSIALLMGGMALLALAIQHRRRAAGQV